MAIKVQNMSLAVCQLHFPVPPLTLWLLIPNIYLQNPLSADSGIKPRPSQSTCIEYYFGAALPMTPFSEANVVIHVNIIIIITSIIIIIHPHIVNSAHPEHLLLFAITRTHTYKMRHSTRIPHKFELYFPHKWYNTINCAYLCALLKSDQSSRSVLGMELLLSLCCYRRGERETASELYWEKKNRE